MALTDAISRRYQRLQLPPVTFSCSHEHAGVAGTVSLSATTFAAIVTDIARSLERQGIHRLLLVNGHGGNYVLGRAYTKSGVIGRPSLATAEIGQAALEHLSVPLNTS